MYAATDVGGEPYAAVDGLMPLCAGQAGQVDAADTIAYQPVNEPGIEVVSAPMVLTVRTGGTGKRELPSGVHSTTPSARRYREKSGQ